MQHTERISSIVRSMENSTTRDLYRGASAIRYLPTFTFLFLFLQASEA